MLAVAVLCAPDGARASGCFGGEPDIRPRDGERNLPINTQARLARRNPMSVSWIAPDGRKLPFGERWVGAGRSTGRLLNPAMPLSPGMHTIRTSDPDVIQRFTVGHERDESPPQLHGALFLKGHFSREPESTCPENSWISVRFPLPEDDRTSPEGFSYLVSLEESGGHPAQILDLLVHAEAVSAGMVRFRIGESGCGCLPHAALRLESHYRITILALDVAGHVSSDSLTGEIDLR